MTRILLSILVVMSASFQEASDFKSKQLKYGRVRSAYQEKDSEIVKILTVARLERTSMRLFIRAFKMEEVVEVWGRDSDSSKYHLIKQFDFCSTSGSLGPKRQEGDYQIPEGFYHIDRFNAWSNFHLSLGINYPNLSDRKLGHKLIPGSDIFIHGDCVTIGCIPITDDKIKVLYILAVEARNNGQVKIPVHIFPARLDNATLEQLVIEEAASKDLVEFWSNLKLGYDYFQNNYTLPIVSVNVDGKYKFTDQ